MGIKSSEIDANRVIIECADRTIEIGEPQVTRIEAQGSVSFQISGNVSESSIVAKVEITDDDIKTVMDSTGKDRDSAVSALEASDGDIAAAIISLKG